MRLIASLKKWRKDLMDLNDAVYTFLAFLFGGGVGTAAVKLFVKSEAEKVIKPLVNPLKDDLDKVKNTYVQCSYCTMQHANIDHLLNSMDSKLDLLLGMKNGH